MPWLLQAEPDGYFRKTEDRWPIAQKYGYMDGSWGKDENAAAIVFTDSPFLLVVMTHNVPDTEKRMSRLCTLLGEYTQRQASLRRPAETPEPSPAPEPTASPEPTPTPAPAATASPAPSAEPAGAPGGAEVSEPSGPIRWWPLAAAVPLCAALILLTRRRKRR